MFGVSWKSIRKKIDKDFGSVPAIGVEELEAMMEVAGNPDARPVLFDARSREEYEVSHLPGAEWVESASEAYERIEQYGFQAPVVVYCSVGYRSAKLVSELMEKGLSEVFNLDGSLFAWANSGRKLVRESQVVNEAHPFDKKWGKLLTGAQHTYSVDASD